MTSNLGDTSNNTTTLSKLTSSIFDKNDQNTEEYTVDYVLLDDNVMGALTCEEWETVGDEDVNLEEANDTSQESSEVEKDIDIGKLKTTK